MRGRRSLRATRRAQPPYHARRPRNRRRKRGSFRNGVFSKKKVLVWKREYDVQLSPTRARFYSKRQVMRPQPTTSSLRNEGKLQSERDASLFFEPLVLQSLTYFHFFFRSSACAETTRTPSTASSSNPLAAKRAAGRLPNKTPGPPKTNKKPTGPLSRIDEKNRNPPSPPTLEPGPTPSDRLRRPGARPAAPTLI